jgi:hypothetical protein
MAVFIAGRPVHFQSYYRPLLRSTARQMLPSVRPELLISRPSGAPGRLGPLRRPRTPGILRPLRRHQTQASWGPLRGRRTPGCRGCRDAPKPQAPRGPVQTNPGESGGIGSWCERGELNPQGLPHWILSPARLPVPPLSHALWPDRRRPASVARHDSIPEDTHRRLPKSLVLLDSNTPVTIWFRHAADETAVEAA